MKACIIACVMFIADDARPQSFPTTPSVCPPDRLEIRDAGEGQAIVTYYNSAQQCSMGLTRVLTSPNGIQVEVTIKVNPVEVEEGRESITLSPIDPQMMSFPPDGLLRDGETQEFLIQGGLS